MRGGLLAPTSWKRRGQSARGGDGAGRFLILSRDGQPEPNLVWKDTVLVRAGQTVDVLLDVTNRGMMFSFEVY